MYWHSHVPRLGWSRVAATALGCIAAATLGLGQNSAPPPTSHTITVDVTKTPILYTDTFSNGGAPKTQPAYRLEVNTNDTIAWKIITSGGMHAAAIVFPNGTPAADANGRSVPLMAWSERDGGSPQLTIVEAAGTYEYEVVVYDETNKTRYIDDPRIIVGNGGIETEWKKISAALGDLREATTELSGMPKQQKQVESIEQELEKKAAELKESK
jgi:hypothetical protein